MASLAAASAFLVSARAGAHSFVLPYTLPVPFGMYLYGAAATLCLTFIALAWFVGVPANARGRLQPTTGDAKPVRLPAWAVDTLRAFAVALLLLTIVACFFGTRDPDGNVAMTLFWVVFVLGLTYATALIGDIFVVANPWRTISQWIGSPRERVHFSYPARLGYWPALAFYVALIWLELFVLPKPVTLGIALVAYTAITLTGARLFGERAWFGHAEMFSVLLRLVGLLAPIEYAIATDEKTVQLRTRAPFSAVIASRPDRLSLVVFVLFMLSSTTFDGLHDTVPWMNVYWKWLLAFAKPLWHFDLIASQRTLEHWYVAFQHTALVLSPFVYFAVYVAVQYAVKAAARSTIGVRDLALAFALTVLPIGLVYNMAHYWTVLLIQLPRLPYLLADPLGRGWIVPFIGIPAPERPPLDMASVWNTEVTLIVVGHLIGVYLSHRIALRVFASRRAALASQVPMLVLMVVYTVVGLWVISQPLALER
ncbi:MAG TPA: hypothetical protein VJ891_16470 [Casimicrobiaceae bacterium]|nr:hypothetical protein [Casimicrobiaceae bacterium]